MKNFKKLVSIMLALVMAAAMAIIPAFAADGDTPADPAAAKAHTYEIYQIFTGKITTEDGKDVLANAVYGANINAEAINALATIGGTGVTAENIGEVDVGKPVSKAVM